MKTALDRKMRKAEVFHYTRIPEGLWIVLRVDGRSFSEFTTRMEFDHPFDMRFHAAMRSGLVDTIESLSGLFGTTHSDEASILLPPRYDMFDRSHEKLVSLFASTFTSSFMASIAWDFDLLRPFPTFDARVITLATVDDVIDYFRWRNMDSWRNCVNSVLYWTLRNEGLTARQADRVCRVNQGEKHDLLHERDINPAKLPGWQRNGSVVRWVIYEKDGFNPLTKEKVKTTRRKLVIEDLERGTKDHFKDLLYAGPHWG